MSRVRIAYTAGEAIGPDWFVVYRSIGINLKQLYGSTETAVFVCVQPDGNVKPDTVGPPVAGVEVRVTEDGEILLKSPGLFKEYYRNPEATQETMTSDGWFRTGDAGYLDEDGYLFIHDRVKDMIISGGENVYPAEVESAIYGHPAVLEVAVIGVPDEKWGEAVKAVCVPKPGTTIDPDDVISWARERIAAFKAPKTIDIIEALPRNASGKILRKDLRAPYWVGRDRQVN
jgi:fatty-acyl-CoA synthase